MERRRVDHTYLTSFAYADATRLGARIAIYDYQQPKIDLVAEVRDALGVAQGMRALDVGTGDGRYAHTISEDGGSAIALDLSLGMLKGVGGTWTRVVADAETLPFASASIDRIVAAHMLYHLARPQQALAQFARVLTPDGVFIATSNTEAHLQEMRRLWDELLNDRGLNTQDPNLALMNLELPVDRLLADARTTFHQVESRLLTSSLCCDNAEALVAYAASTTAAMTTSELGYDLLTPFGDKVRALIQCDGAFNVTTQVILVRCTDPRSTPLQLIEHQ